MNAAGRWGAAAVMRLAKTSHFGLRAYALAADLCSQNPRARSCDGIELSARIGLASWPPVLARSMREVIRAILDVFGADFIEREGGNRLAREVQFREVD